MSNNESILKKVYVESYGCAVNKYDSEIILGYLLENGYHIVDDPIVAGIVIINTCGVKKQTEDKIGERLRRLSSLNKPLIIMGCLPRINLRLIKRSAPKFTAILDPKSINKTLLAVESAKKGKFGEIFFSDKPFDKISIPKRRINPLIDIIQIAEGCNGTCSYCCVKNARGSIYSYSCKKIIEKLKSAVLNGVREIWVTSQDTAAYGIDSGIRLPELLEDICKIDGDFFVRVGMMTPNQAIPIMPQLIKSFHNDKIYKFLHIPLQSGDDKILKLMNREYTVSDFLMIAKEFRKAIPQISISTDVIVGFPGESDDAFKRTQMIIENVHPDIVNISKFFPRPNTIAEKMDPISFTKIKKRSKSLTSLVHKISLENNLKWLNWEGKVFVDEKGSGSSWIGRNSYYKPFVIKSNKNLGGISLQIKAIKAFPSYLEGEIVNVS